MSSLPPLPPVQHPRCQQLMSTLGKEEPDGRGASETDWKRHQREGDRRTAVSGFINKRVLKTRWVCLPLWALTFPGRGWPGGQHCAHHPPPSPGALEADDPPLQRRPSPSLCLCGLTHSKHGIKPHPIPWGPCPGLGCPCLSPNPGRGGGQACSASSPPAPRLSQAHSTNGTGLTDRQMGRLLSADRI